MEPQTKMLYYLKLACQLSVSSHFCYLYFSSLFVVCDPCKSNLKGVNHMNCARAHTHTHTPRKHSSKTAQNTPRDPRGPAHGGRPSQHR